MNSSARVETPSVLIVFGATGDLFQKKIIPATYLLFTQHRLPPQFKIVGFGRRPLGESEFQERVKDVVPEASPAFLQLFSYVQGAFDEPAAFTRLHDTLLAIEATWNIQSAKAFYFAVPPELFENLFVQCKKAELIDEASRLLIEKPFGRNLAEAQALNSKINSFFNESAVYRIEHYLTKDTLRTLPYLRATTILGKLLKAEMIEHIHVRLIEELGVENRGPFYDHIGAWRDVGENHVLEMLALTLMDLPESDSPQALIARRTAFIHTLPKLDGPSLAQGVVRAQYKGYRDIAGVAPDSGTETYFKLSFTLTEKYGGIPVTLEAGKRFKPARKGIEVSLKPHAPARRVVIGLEPRMATIVEYTHGQEEVLFENTNPVKTSYAEQYADVIVQALREDHSWFMGAEEVEAEWRFADPISEAFATNQVPLRFYPPDLPEYKGL